MASTDIRTLIKKAGGTYAVARACGVGAPAVSQWIAAGRIPATDLQGRTDYASQILKMTDEEMDVWDLRLIGRR